VRYYFGPPNEEVVLQKRENGNVYQICEGIKWNTHRDERGADGRM
jgi:hypothetical protein